jgi:hypothetical protein
LTRIFATYYASDVVKQRAENMDTYMSAMTSQLRGSGESSATMSAFEKALMDDTGAELTKADYLAL